MGIAASAACCAVEGACCLCSSLTCCARLCGCCGGGGSGGAKGYPEGAGRMGSLILVRTGMNVRCVHPPLPRPRRLAASPSRLSIHLPARPRLPFGHARSPTRVPPGMPAIFHRMSADP